jgi:hypothetical protein
MWINLLYYNNHEVVFQSNPITKDITSNQLIGYHWLWSSYCNINKCLLFLSLWIHPGFKLDSCCSTIHFLCNVLSTIVCRFDLFLFSHCIVCPSSIYGFWLPFWPFSFWSLYCLSIDIRLLITVLTFFFLAIVLSVLLWFTASDYRFVLYLFGHCIVCPSLIYGFWLPFWPFFFWSLYCLSFFDLWLLITVFWYLSTFLYIPVEYLLIDSIT